MFGFGILSGLLILPLVGALALLLLRGDDESTRNNARWIALWTTIATFVLSLFAWAEFNPASAGFQLVEQRSWFSAAIAYRLGVDGMSMPFVLLTTFLMPFCIGASWLAIDKRVKEYMIAFLVLETLMIGVFERARSVAVLSVLRGRPDPDVPHHRRLGRQAARLRGVQVLPLHAARLAADAARDHGDVLVRQARPTSPCCCTRNSRPACRNGCGWRSSPRSRSRCRCGRSTPGCPTRMSRRRPPAR